MGKLSSVVFTALLAWGCAQTTSQQTNNQATEDNTLSAAEKRQGWQLLFDGKSMEHFRGFRKNEVPNGWEVADGAITLSGDRAGDIITKKKYDDFELLIDWKISEGGNSGIFYHVSEDTAYANTYNSGPEMQVLDDERHPYQGRLYKISKK